MNLSHTLQPSLLFVLSIERKYLQHLRKLNKVSTATQQLYSIFKLPRLSPGLTNSPKKHEKLLVSLQSHNVL